MKKEQLEIRFEAATLFHPPLRSRQRRLRAQWWFSRMRWVVNQALDWKPAPPPRPEQIYLTLAGSRWR